MYSLAIMKQFPNARIAAFDLNEDMIGAFRSKLEKRKELGSKVNLFVASVIEPLPGLNGGFDLVVTAGVLEYVDMREAVKNLSEHLIGGGYFLNVSVKDNLFGKLVGRFYDLEPYSVDEKVRAFAENSFALVKVMQFPPTREAYLFQKAA
jgi:SAM-dependent methyltransferase